MKGLAKRGWSALRWLAALTLLGLAWNLKDPHLLLLRQLETPFLLACSVLGIFFALRRPQGAAKWLAIAVFGAALVLTLAGEAAFRYRKHDVLSGQRPAARLLGAHFVVGYEEVEALRPLAAQGLIGGIFVTQRNARGKAAGTLREEIAALQALRQSAGLPPLIVATDQEGGRVSRLSPPLTRLPALAELVAQSASPEELEQKAEAYGARQGAELASVGVTVNFGPVLDLRYERPGNPLDFHSLIAERAISSDPAVAARVAQAYGRGLQQKGVTPTLKHFPGLGRVADDTHHFSARLEIPVAELAARDWMPFRQVAAQSPALIMLAHVVLPEVDPENPVSFSRAAVQTLLRGEWKHEGVLISDDLTMGAAYNRGLCEAAVKALNAGVDLLLVAYDYEKYFEAMHCAARAYEKRALELPMLERSRLRLARLLPGA